MPPSVPNSGSPWSGDDIPVGEGLGEIEWDAARSEPLDGRDRAERRGDSVPPTSRRWGLAAGALALVAAVAIVATLVSGDDNPDESLTPVTGDTALVTPTTLATLPPITTAPPSTVAIENDRALPDVAVPNVVDTPPGTRGPLVDGATIEVPELVAAITTSTDVVMLNDSGQLITTTFPSGATSVFDIPPGSIGGFAGGSGIAASPDGTIFSNDSGGMVIVSTAGDVATIDVSEFTEPDSALSSQLIPIGWIEQPGAPAAFVVLGIDQESTQREFVVQLDGTVDVARTQRFSSFALPLPAQGSRLVNDAGGAYVSDVDGNTNRISAGTILATSLDRLLLRECDATRVCSTVLRDLDGDNVETVSLPPAFELQFFAASLSPDATTVVFSSFGFTQNRTMIDLATGEIVVFESFDDFQLGQTWALDSSGEFGRSNEPGLQFMHRSGVAVNLASEAGRVNAFAVRPAVATGS